MRDSDSRDYQRNCRSYHHPQFISKGYSMFKLMEAGKKCSFFSGPATKALSHPPPLGLVAKGTFSSAKRQINKQSQKNISKLLISAEYLISTLELELNTGNLVIILLIRICKEFLPLI